VAVLLAALLLAVPPLMAVREADPLPPSPRPAPALFSSLNAASVLIVRVYASAARDDEFVELGNGGDLPIDLSGWAVTDREATARFPIDSILPARGRVLIAQNATSYAEDTLAIADFALLGRDARRMEGGVLRLADTGDEVLLLDPSGAAVDVYAWGDSSYAGAGWTGRPADRMGRGEIAIRLHGPQGAWSDRDLADDWEGPRRYRLGQSSFDAEAFDLTGSVTAVLSPDAGDAPLLRFLGSARTTIEVSVYTFASERIASVLADAARRDVRIRVLLDGGPVGGIPAEEHNITHGLAGAGVDIRWLTGGPDVVKRYRFLHAKYAIVDSRAAWVGSENFGDAGFPSGRTGNRGWSVVVEDAGLATRLQAVFEADFDPRRRDSIPLETVSDHPLPPPPALPAWSGSPPSGPRRARLMIGPDTSLDPDGVVRMFASARDRISLEAFYLEDAWRGAPSPFLEAAFEAARRGIAVRILLDGSWSSVQPESGTNDETLARINDRAKAGQLPLEVRLLEPRGSIERLHNKGVVVDGHTVLVSSMNWALGSATENREIGILLEDDAVARFFEAAFNADWEGRSTSGSDLLRFEDPVALVGLYALVAAASAVSLRKLRVGDKGIKPGLRLRTRGPIGTPFRRRRGEVRLLPPELVAEPRPGRRRRVGTRRGREEA
jgi:phosphatidylserine/phosphatidylglycerophosphate/cardiolipin synthase-like enzyme